MTATPTTDFDREAMFCEDAAAAIDCAKGAARDGGLDYIVIRSLTEESEFATLPEGNDYPAGWNPVCVVTSDGREIPA